MRRKVFDREANILRRTAHSDIEGRKRMACPTGDGQMKGVGGPERRASLVHQGARVPDVHGDHREGAAVLANPGIKRRLRGGSRGGLDSTGARYDAKDRGELRDSPVAERDGAGTSGKPSGHEP